MCVYVSVHHMCVCVCVCVCVPVCVCVRAYGNVDGGKRPPKIAVEGSPGRMAGEAVCSGAFFSLCRDVVTPKYRPSLRVLFPKLPTAQLQSQVRVPEFSWQEQERNEIYMVGMKEGPILTPSVWFPKHMGPSHCAERPLLPQAPLRESRSSSKGLALLPGDGAGEPVMFFMKLG